MAAVECTYVSETAETVEIDHEHDVRSLRSAVAVAASAGGLSESRAERFRYFENYISICFSISVSKTGRRTNNNHRRHRPYDDVDG